MPLEMVYAALAETGKVQTRVRDLPSRVVVYLLLAAGLFAEIGYRQVWARMTAGLEGIAVPTPTAGALAQTRRRIGATPLKALFELLAGSAAGPATKGVYWRGPLVTAVDGTTLCCPDSEANLAVFRCGGGHHGGTGADLLIRVKNGCSLPVCDRLPDGSYVSRIGPVEVRVIRASVTILTSAGRSSQTYTLVSTILDPDCSAQDIIGLYRERWEIETSFLELKSTILGGRVLRARTPGGIAQEVHALLVTYQALRIAITDATIARPDIDPDRASFSGPLNAARDQLVQAAGVTADTVIDLAGVIGRHVRNAAMPPPPPAAHHSPRSQTSDLQLRHHPDRHPHDRRPLTTPASA